MNSRVAHAIAIAALVMTLTLFGWVMFASAHSNVDPDEINHFHWSDGSVHMTPEPGTTTTTTTPPSTTPPSTTGLPLAFSYQTVYAYTGQILTATVCIPESATPLTDWPNFSLEFKVFHFESGSLMAQGSAQQRLDFNFTVPRTGFFVIQVQYDKGDGSPVSGWLDSRKGYVPAGGASHCSQQPVPPFWVHGETAPAGSGGLQ